jgi:hypothetical protein
VLFPPAECPNLFNVSASYLPAFSIYRAVEIIKFNKNIKRKPWQKIQKLNVPLKGSVQ